MADDHNEKAVSLFDKLADGYAERFMNVDHYGEGLQFFINQLDSEATILDVACGPGNICKYLLDRQPDFSIQGIEMSPKMIELARAANPTATFSRFDAREIAQFPGQFDAVVVGFLFPYLSMDKVLRFLFQVKSKLKNGGILYISTIENEYEESGLQESSTGEQLMQYFYTGDWLKNQLEGLGFDILNEERVRYSGSDQQEVVDIVLISKMKL